MIERIISILVLVGVVIVAVVIGTYILKLLLGLLVIGGVVYLLKRNNVF